MKILRPLTTKWSPSRFATVVIPATSDPASGSVIARAAICSPRIAGASHLRFCSSVPNLNTGGVAISAWTAKAELPEPPEDRVWEGLLLPLLEVGLDLLVEEPSDVQPELLVGVGEVHRAWSLGSNGRRAAYGMIPGPRAGRVSPFRKSIVSGSWIGLGNQEAAQEDAQAQAQEDA